MIFRTPRVTVGGNVWGEGNPSPQAGAWSNGCGAYRRRPVARIEGVKGGDPFRKA